MDESMLMLLESMAKKKKVKAIGEIGLDFHYDNSPRDIQRHWFRAQIQMAKRVGKPIIIHDREANQETFDILNEEEAFENGVLMHCYSGSAELAKEYIKRGAYLSIAGPVTYKNARKTVEVAKQADLNHLMIETDCPYLTPVPYRGKRNESAYVRYVAERIAEIRGITVEEVAQATLNNAKRFFNIEI
jgi:TatD DNase family protein